METSSLISLGPDLSDELLPGEHGDLLAHVGHSVVEGVIVIRVNDLHNVRPHLHAGPRQDEVEAVQDKASEITLVEVLEQGICGASRTNKEFNLSCARTSGVSRRIRRRKPLA